MTNEFNLITGKLPCDVIVNGFLCPIYTNTSICMDCLVALESDMPEEAKKKIVLGRLFSGPIYEGDREAAFSAALEFLRGAPTPEYEKANIPHSKEQSIFWSLDSPAIVASFHQAYGLTLKELKDMHWWEFLALLQNIPSDTRMGQLFSTRASLVDVKAKPDQQLRQREVKKAAKPKDTRTKEEKQRDAMKAMAEAF